MSFCDAGNSRGGWIPLSQIKHDFSNTFGNFLKGCVWVGPGSDGLMVFGQYFKLTKGRTGPIYRTQQNGNDESLARLVPLDGPLDFDGIAGVVGKGVGADEQQNDSAVLSC
ncbi:MAG: hypothetical protein AAF329_25510 [Cyanobacteria bacterium P01_A01_bin.17]